jgi:CheY-like chemotaxis protein
MEAETAEAGLRLAQATPPVLALMDIQLPGMNGIEALRHLRADPRTQAIPVIVVTASVMDQDRRKILVAGFDGYQAKPIEATQFELQCVARSGGRPRSGYDAGGGPEVGHVHNRPDGHRGGHRRARTDSDG